MQSSCIIICHLQRAVFTIEINYLMLIILMPDINIKFICRRQVSWCRETMLIVLVQCIRAHPYCHVPPTIGLQDMVA